MLQIKDREFIVESATLFAEIRKLAEARNMWGNRNEGIAWFVEVRTQENNTGEHDGWEPSIDCICRFPKIPWRDIEGQVLEWGDSWDEVMGNVISSLYLYNHCPIKNSRLEFTDRRGTTFRLRWQGQCDLFWDEEYKDNVDLLIETDVRFIGIAVYEANPSIARDMLAAFQNPDGFIAGPIGGYAEGSTAQFKPKLD